MDGFQGKNWFQGARPELQFLANSSGDRIRLITSATQYFEFKRAASGSDVFLGVIGSNGVLVHVPRTGTEEVDRYEYHDRAGNVMTLFGFDALPMYDQVQGQLWKIQNADGGTGAGTVYVSSSHSTVTLASALAGFEQEGGYPTKRVSTFFDAAGRRYTFGYSSSSIAGQKRLTDITVDTLAGTTWSTVSKVEYAYYTSDVTDKGLTGDLKTITKTLYLSPRGGQPVTAQRVRYFRYYTGSSFDATTNPGYPHLMKLSVAAEGIARYLADNPSGSYESASDADLKPYSKAFLTYAQNTFSDKVNRLYKAVLNGDCSCTTGSPNGEVEYSYTQNTAFTDTTAYDCSGDWTSTQWLMRVTTKRPDGSWTVAYLDDWYQVLATITADGDPADTPYNPSSQTGRRLWITKYQRDAQGRVVAIDSPEAVNWPSYVHSSGTVPARSSDGFVWRVQYADDSSGLNEPLLRGAVAARIGHSKGAGGTFYVDQSAAYLTTGDGTANWTHTVKTESGVDYVVTNPVTSSTRVYRNEVAAPGSAGDYDETTFATGTSEFWSSTSWLRKRVSVTLPAVSTNNGGPGTALTQEKYLRRDGRVQFTEETDGVWNFFEYDSLGRIVRTIRDADARTTYSSLTTAASDFGITLPTAGVGTFLTTESTYDAQNRLVSTKQVDSLRETASYFGKLKDDRLVIFSVPRRTGSSSYTYYGPVGYTVLNHGGRPEVEGVLQLAGTGNDDALIDQWIKASPNDSADPIAAIDTTHAAVTRLSTTAYSKSGARVEETRQFGAIPSSLSGASSTDYDATTFGYDNLGRPWRTAEPSGTIRRTVYNKAGQVVETWIGTNDHSFTRGSASGTDDMTKVEARAYDGPDSTTGSIGNNHVTKITQDADGAMDGSGNWTTTSDQRVTQYAYDYQGRAYLTISPVSPIATLVKFDNRDRAVAAAEYTSATGLSDPNSSGGTDPVASSAQSGRLSATEISYDELGRAWITIRHNVLVENGGNGSFSTGNDQRYVSVFDAGGRVVASYGPDLQKNKYDRLGRRIRAYTLAQVGSADYAAWTTVGENDIVLEELQTIYDNATGNVLATIQLQRHHDMINLPTGPLDKNVDGDWNVLYYDDLFNGDGYPASRPQITATWYDELDRPTASVQMGTFDLSGSGNWAFSRTGTNFGNGAGALPTRSADYLVTSTVYNKDGSVQQVTDPRGLTTKFLYDAAGRQTAVISNYTQEPPSGGFSSSDDDRDHDTYVRYKYEHSLMTYLWVDTRANHTDPSSASSYDQVTQYKYGTTKLGSGQVPGDGTEPKSCIATGHLLREAVYPPQSSGQSSADRTVYSAYDALGEKVWTRDQNGTEVVTQYDLGAREAGRFVKAVPDSKVDGWVKAITLDYTDRGQVRNVNQYSSASYNSGTGLWSASGELNGVQYAYEDFGNIAGIKQDRDSVVGGSGTAAYEVSFGYSLQNFADNTHTGRPRVQRDWMHLPLSGSNSYTVEYRYEGGTPNYGDLTALDQMAGRVSGIRVNSSENRVGYQYLGAGTLVGTSYPETGWGYPPMVQSVRFDNQSPAAYEALDRFNRVTIDRWTGGSGQGGGTPHELHLTYDEDSNIVRAEDPKIIGGSSGGSYYFPYSTQYSMDGLNRVVKADRGHWDGTAISGSSPRLIDDWALTQTGNWHTTHRQINAPDNPNSTPPDAYTETSAPGTLGEVEFSESRDHSSANEITGRTITGGLSASATPDYSKAGELRDDGRVITGGAQGRLFVYDAFGRMTEVRRVTSRSGTSVSSEPIAQYKYNGLGQRIAWHRNPSPWGSVSSSDPWIFLVYDDRWRVVGIYHEANTVYTPKEVDVPHNAGFDGRGGSSYIDTYALRDFDGSYGAASELSTAASGALGLRHYYCQNWRADVVSLVDTSGRWPGWYKYSAYGQCQKLTVPDVDNGSGLGFRDNGIDINDLLRFLAQYGLGSVAADLTYDGGVDINDLLLFLAGYQAGGGMPESRFMYAGYVYDPLDNVDNDYDSDKGGGIYHVRHRVFSPELGRWTRRDPLGYYDDSANLIEYVADAVVAAIDPTGLFWRQAPTTDTPLPALPQDTPTKIPWSQLPKLIPRLLPDIPKWIDDLPLKRWIDKPLRRLIGMPPRKTYEDPGRIHNPPIRDPLKPHLILLPGELVKHPDRWTHPGPRDSLPGPGLRWDFGNGCHFEIGANPRPDGKVDTPFKLVIPF